jgi:hypothetical protein
MNSTLMDCECDKWLPEYICICQGDKEIDLYSSKNC